MIPLPAMTVSLDITLKEANVSKNADMVSDLMDQDASLALTRAVINAMPLLLTVTDACSP
jgi:hypothetical protein